MAFSLFWVEISLSLSVDDTLVGWSVLRDEVVRLSVLRGEIVRLSVWGDEVVCVD